MIKERDTASKKLHGTRSGYNRHLRIGQKPCDECRLEHNRALREYRHKNSDARAKPRIYQQALRELKERHLEEWTTIYEQRLRDEGL